MSNAGPYDQGINEGMQTAFKDYFDGKVDEDRAKANFETAISEKYPELNKELQELAEKHDVSKTAIATAWILRHPAGMQVVTGTASEARLTEIIDACKIQLSREEWYRLYLAAGHILP